MLLARKVTVCRCRMKKTSPRDFRFRRTTLVSAGFLCILLSGALNRPAISQQQSTQAPASANAEQKPANQEPAAEIAVKDEATTSNVAEAAQFRVNVKLVLARVVVRDSAGHAVGNLKKEDFELFDSGKQQTISNFDAEHVPAAPAASPVASPASSSGAPAGAANPTPSPPTFPSRYVAYVFDDLRLSFGDLVHVREAAKQLIDELPGGDRAAIFSTSGQTVQDFTDDRAKLQKTLKDLMPHPLPGLSDTRCPDITLYEADLIVNKLDADALQTAINDYLYCSEAATLLSAPNALGLNPHLIASSSSFVQGVATQVLNIGEQAGRTALRSLNDAVRRMSVLPGQRILVLVSPGFLTPNLEYEYNDLINRALRGQVTMNSLDARGLYVVLPNGDASERGRADIDVQGQSNQPTGRSTLQAQSALAESDILIALASGTGGTIFQNNNDMNQGLRRVADAPEYWYVLGFTPQGLKNDGKFHTLKVTLANHQKYELQARRGYYAPRKTEDAAEEAKQEMEDEVLSSEELHQLPVVLHTEFFKPAEDAAKLTVLARIDVKRLHYKQAQDRNQNDLTVITAVFDRNGNLLEANQKIVAMRWKSETLQAKLATGITLRTSFDVKPGRYMVRVVARDSEQQQMSAENGTVEIP